MSVCSRCGATFGCAMADGVPGPCWCTTLPPVVAVPGEAASCWCPACLRQHIEATAAASPRFIEEWTPMIVDTDHLGFAAAFCTTSAFVPQVLMVWRQRGAPGISSGMYLIFILGVALWLLYGLALHSWPVVIANGLTLVLASCVLGMKWYFGRHA